jgi:hypothetical protein
MAKKSAGKGKGDGQSIASYFKAIFREDPALLDSRSNDEILQRWLKNCTF